MRPYTCFVTFLPLLAPLSALAETILVSDTSSNILSRDPIMRPFVARTSPAYILARSPHSDDEKECSSDRIRCGGVCFPDTYSCCPNNASGGCPVTENCQEDNGRYGCCPDGETCHWGDGDDDDDDDDDDDRWSIFSNIENLGDDIKDGWNDLFGNSGASLKLELSAVWAVTTVVVMRLVVM